MSKDDKNVSSSNLNVCMSNLSETRDQQKRAYLGFGTPAELRKLMTAEIEPTRASCEFLYSYRVLCCRFLDWPLGEGGGEYDLDVVLLTLLPAVLLPLELRDEVEFCINGSSSSQLELSPIDNI